MAIDIKISGTERFKDIKTIQVPTEVVIKSPNKLIEKAEEIVAKIRLIHGEIYQENGICINLKKKKEKEDN